MTACYLRLEGVNLNNFVFDVHDLSTIRGGSFLLLKAVEWVEKRFGLKPVSTGASSGLFRFETDKPEDLRSEVESFLHKHQQLRHATFVVDIVPDENDYPHTREKLAAMNRWRQQQQPTVAVPTAGEGGQGVCAFDRVRPAVSTEAGEGISASVLARRTFGRKEKQRFYQDEMKKVTPESDVAELLDWIEKVNFAVDLEALTTANEKGSRSRKMAVIYFDGNKFGDLQRKKCTSPKAHADFDHALKSCRRDALRGLLDSIRTETSGWLANETTVRLETLLWGGDELIWVVPAWKGWATAALFYDVSKEWAFDGTPLTHAGGIVFCHHNAPIHKITALAKSLAGLAKESLDPGSHATGDLFAYQVLESFDYVAGDLEDFRKTRVPKGGSAVELLVSAVGMGEVKAHFETLRRDFPRSKLHQIIEELSHGPEGAADRTIASTTELLTENAREALDKLCKFFNPAKTPSHTHWFHIADLWDYAGD
jgi:hypothetical protein